MTGKTHYLYTLAFDAEPEPVVFYVGHTNDPKRRETEHRACAKDPDNTEYKYRWCRELEAIGVKWNFIVLHAIEDDEDAEYEWVLQFARKNLKNNISFIEGLPLTNMRAGDLLSEILLDKTIQTKEDIKAYKRTRAEQRAVNYHREQSANFVPNERSNQFIQYMQALGEESQAETLAAKAKAAARAKKYRDMLNDPERARRIREETERLMKEDETKHT